MEPSPDTISSLSTLFINISCSLSLVGTLGVLILVSWLKVRTQFSVYIKVLLLTDLIYSVFSLIARNIKSQSCPNGTCDIIMFFMVLSFQFSLIWTISFAVNTYLLIIKDRPRIESYTLWYWIIGIFWSIALGFIPVLFDGYGPSRYYGCGINKDLPQNEALWVGIFIQFTPLLIALTLIVIFYGLVVRSLYLATKRTGDCVEIKKIAYQLMPFPTIFAVCGFPGLFETIYQLSTGKSSGWVIIVSAFLFRIIGFLNALYFGFTRKVREELFKKFKKETGTELSGSVASSFYGMKNEPPSDYVLIRENQTSAAGYL